MMRSGLKTLTKLALRRDRMKLPLWIVGFVGLLMAIVPMIRQVYGDQASLNTLHQSFGANPAGLFMTGPMEAASFGGLMTIESLLWWGLTIAFLNTLLIIRHTRNNEEQGGAELLFSTRTHRTAGLTSAMLIAVMVNAIIAVAIGVGFSLIESSWSDKSAWVYGVAMGAFGLFWAATASFIAQLTDSSRSANGILAGLIGLSFVVRGIGDFLGKTNANGSFESHIISILSPFGFLQAARPLIAPDWLPIVFLLIITACIFVASLVIASQRDVGSGLLPSRTGKASASKLLRTPLGLTLKLHKNIFIGWLLGCLAMAATIGVLVPEMSNFYGNNETMTRVIEAMSGSGDLIPAFLSSMLTIITLMIFAYTVQALGRLRSEETSGRLENLLAGQLGKLHWLLLHAIIVAVLGLLMLLASGLSLATMTNLASTYSVNIADYILAATSYWPLLMLFIGIYVFGFGLFPKLGGTITWTYFGFVAFMSWLGPLLDLPKAVINLSVTSHIAAPPAQDISAAPLLLISAFGIALFIAGVTAWRQRDLA